MYGLRSKRRIKTGFSSPQVKASYVLVRPINRLPFTPDTTVEMKSLSLSSFSPEPRHFTVMLSVNGGLRRQFHCLCLCTPAAAGSWKDCAPLITGTEMFGSASLYAHL
ncbi:unnamed protein product [Ixodes pacificus]